ncbi:hypothetical protein Hanom_Chr10g00912701 [Helianthus anomalus]
MKEAEEEVDNTLVIVPIGEVKDVTPEEVSLNKRKIIEKRHSESKDYKEDNDEDEEYIDDFEAIDNYDDDGNEDQGATGLMIVKPSEEERELDENRTRESMLEELDLEDGNLNFDIKEEIPPTPKREYTFKFVNEVDNFNDVIIEEGSDLSEEDTPFRHFGVDDDFPTLNEFFQSHNED